LRAQKKAQIFSQPGVINRDYQGEIADYGSSVKINSIGDPTISTYVPNTPISAPQALTGVQRNLTINQGSYFNFEVDDVDAAQNVLDVMPEALDRAGYRLADATDQYIAAQYVLAATVPVAGQTATVIGTSASPIVIDNSTHFLYDSLVAAKVRMTETNVPEAGRWAIVPAWAEGAMSLDPRFVGLRGFDDNSILLNGSIGQAAGFNIMVSNNVPFTPGTPAVDYKIICGVSSAASLAEQINKVEAFRPQNMFADAVKGMNLWGEAVIRAYQVVIIHANDGLGLAGPGPSEPAA
jgi:hypothetical protein